MQTTKTTNIPPRAENKWLMAAFGLAAFYLATSLYIATRRLLWYDEIFTAVIVRLPNLSVMWRALTDRPFGVQGPIGYYVIAQIFDHVFGPGEIGIRIPSALGLAAGMLIVFDCVRRVTSGACGIIAMGVLSCSFLPYFGHEGRAYGLFFMFVAASLWLWIHGGGRAATVAFGVVFFFALQMHFYACLCLVPYGVVELLRGRLRRPSGKLLAGIIGVFCSAAIMLPVLQTASGERVTFWARPHPQALVDVYTEIFPSGIFLLGLIVILRVVSVTRPPLKVEDPMSEAERLGWLFLLVPIAGYVVAVFLTNAFYNRYFIGVVPGIAVGVSCWAWRHLRESRVLLAGVLIVLHGYGGAKELWSARGNYPHESRMRQVIGLENLLSEEGKHFIVMNCTTDEALFVEAQYYSKHPERYVAVLRGNFDPGVIWRRYAPLQFWTFDELKQHAASSAVITPEADALEPLKGNGLKLEVRLVEPLPVIYLSPAGEK